MSEHKAEITPRKPVVVHDDGPQTGTDTVTIGCKWPNGIVMQLYDVIEETIFVNGVAVKENRSVVREDAPTFVLNGFSVDLGEMAQGIPPEHQIVGGYGLTHGIPRDFAEEWFKQNSQLSLVKNRLIFMEANEQRGRSHAKELKSLQCGIQPIDPSNPAERVGLRKGAIKQDRVGATAEE
jgi:hypothetical protein